MSDGDQGDYPYAEFVEEVGVLALVEFQITPSEWRFLRCLETGLWWRKNSAGYTGFLSEAGLYNAARADQAVRGSPEKVEAYTVEAAIEDAWGLRPGNGWVDVERAQRGFT